jgi:alanyl-tRNA synthetase
VADLPETVASLRAENERLSAELAELRGELLAGRIAALETVDRDGTVWRIGTVSGFEANAVGEAAKEAVGDAGDAVAVVGDGERPFVVVASTGAVHAGEVVDAVTDAFGGGGGGGPPFAQGGGLDADATEVVAFLREYSDDPDE